MVAVLDGCTMGTESVFAALLITKILRKEARKWYYHDFQKPVSLTLSQLLEKVVEAVFNDLKSIRNLLSLDKAELLSTLLLGLVDEDQYCAEFIIIGDGMLKIDGRLYEFEQENTPDYLAYHLGKDFQIWNATHDQRISVSSFQDLAITTDGIHTFSTIDKATDQRAISSILDFLLTDVSNMEQIHMLERKIRFIANEWKHEPTDDLAIIRAIVND